MIGIGCERAVHARPTFAALALALRQVRLLAGAWRQRGIVRRLGRLAQFLFQFGDALFEEGDGRGQRGVLRGLLCDDLRLRKDHRNQIVMRKRAEGRTVFADSESKCESRRKQNLAIRTCATPCPHVRSLALSNGGGEQIPMDSSKSGMGLRGQRFSLLAKDGKVAELNIGDPGAFKVSSAEHMLEQLAYRQNNSQVLRAHAPVATKNRTERPQIIWPSYI